MLELGSIADFLKIKTIAHEEIEKARIIDHLIYFREINTKKS